jgi:HlyD family secretion protein
MRAQAAATLDQARAALADLQVNRDYNVAQARADVADRQATYDQITKDLTRNESEVITGGVSHQTVDLLRAQATSAQAQLQAAQAKLVLQLQGYTIAQQQAAVAVAVGSLAAANWRFDQRHAVAPEAGLIADTFVKPGETLAAGTPALELLPPQNIRVRFFVPEAALARLHQGQLVAITCDSCPNNLTARISFIAAQSEYTPPVIYSQDTRGNLVYLIEARPALDQASILKPGQPVNVIPQPSAGPP